MSSLRGPALVSQCNNNVTNSVCKRSPLKCRQQYNSDSAVRLARVYCAEAVLTGWLAGTVEAAMLVELG
ncbi:hypothetical protein E2C01_064052 [Portunus trituberculatus]|uniref:Uncharacterized protein n=1 Tax=Portunus trituberculatus TaxID=210409 RepID=A0A5B7HAQ9_PORTR|nr:hypothetical protein [Portunus trituberculatus]